MTWFRSRTAALTARVEALTEERDDARRDARAALSSMTTMAGHADLDHRRYATARTRDRRRIDRLIRAVIRQRANLAAAERQCAALQARLDMAVGLDHPNLDLGSSWQDRREDKVRGGAK